MDWREVGAGQACGWLALYLIRGNRYSTDSVAVSVIDGLVYGNGAAIALKLSSQKR